MTGSDVVELSVKKMSNKQKWTKTTVSGDEFRLTNQDNSNHLTAVASGNNDATTLTSKFNHCIHPWTKLYI